ncbi:sensor histidine kinase [Cupriavidus gilardii]|uniref:sensor histidine kinase n=1 Tax=Cupriavidus gilardii TaxID=82541 RepID=UPI0021BF1303|nr:HAMP domain-containing histidine kinase [Cupriavidus gilardii]
MAFRLTLNYSLLAVATTFVLLLFLYFQTLGVLHGEYARQIQATAQRMAAHYDARGLDSLVDEIGQLLADRVDVDTEMYLLLDAEGRLLAGNPERFRDILPGGRHDVVDLPVIREGMQTVGGLREMPLPGGVTLVVGRDMRDVQGIERLIRQSVMAAALVAVVLVAAGTYVFRRELLFRVADIRRTAARVGAGELQQRVPAPVRPDEFAHLNHDINTMLDRIQALMDGVRNVSDSVAHNVRTPLARVLTGLRTAPAGSREALLASHRRAIGELEDLVVMVEKLLHIAEAESGMRRQSFTTVRLDRIAADVADLYGPMVDEHGGELILDCEPASVQGDPDLLAGALANLVENAVKYAGRPARIHVAARAGDGIASLTVRDDGVGIPADQLPRLGTRFHRLHRETHGYGLGLASVRAIVGLHGGSIVFRDALPGLAAHIELPATHA